MILKERLVYTAGTFKIDDDLTKCRRLLVRTSVLRSPFSAKYWNERSNPPKFFLGYCSIFIGDYVFSVFPLEFENQIVLLWDNLAAQLYARILCEALNINANLVRLRVSIPLPGVVVPVPGDTNSFPGCPYNFIKFKLEPGCRILVTGVGEEVEICEGGDFETTVPALAAPPPKYPGDQARDEDPARSEPEEGELPGDTAPATIDDPDSSLFGPLGNVVGIAGSGATGTYIPRTSPPSRVPPDSSGNFVLTYRFLVFFAGENAYEVLVNGVNVDPGAGYRLDSASWVLI